MLRSPSTHRLFIALFITTACDPGDLADPVEIDTAQSPAFGTGATDTGRFYRLKSVASGLCIDVANRAQADDAPVVQWTCSGSATAENQHFYFRHVGFFTDAANQRVNYYQMSAKHSAKCLRISGGSASNGAALLQDGCARGGADFTGTRFHAVRIGTTSPARYQLVTQTSGKCLQAVGTTTGASLQQQPCGTGTSFLFHLEGIAPPGASDANGRWSPIYTVQNVPAAAALLPNGKVLAWSSWKPYRFGGSGSLDQTVTVLWDPARPTAPTSKLVTNTVHNMFCPGIAMLTDGRIFVNGGDDRYTQTTSIYDAATDTWTRAAAMAQRRWYNSSVTLPDGRVFTLGGNRTSGDSGVGEIWNPANNTWTTVPNATMDHLMKDAVAANRAQEHPRLLVGPNGKVFIAGPNKHMYWYTVTGSGAVASAGTRGDDEFSQNDVTVMFDVGKILKAGGNPNYDNGGDAARHAPSSHASYVIDINGGGTAAVTKLPPMKYPRAFGNGVVLANGQVVVAGGLDNAKGFSDDGAIMVAELFDPATNTWRELAPMAKPRPYHSVALLLPDGRVLVGGGGLCSSSDDCAVNHPDFEVLSPPYLFGVRPTLAGAPASITPGGAPFPVTVTGTVTGFSLVRMSTVTHSTNTDQRFLRLAASGTGGTRMVTPPANKNLAPPGYYLLFALNGQTPSTAAIVQIR